MIRSLTAAVAAVAAALSLAAPATASLLPTGPLGGGGGFVMQTCGESGSSQGWTSSNNAPARVETFTDCPPALGRIPERPDTRFYTGLHAGGKRGRDSPTLDDAQAGDQAELTFTATPGTQITRIRMWRAAGKVDDNDWLAYTKAGATTIDGCEFTFPAGDCLAGAQGGWSPDGENDTDPGFSSYYDSALPANLQGLSASTFTVGIRCRAQGDSICANAYLFSSAYAEIYSAFLTLSDTSAPALGAAGGDWAGTSTITGAPAFTIAGSDNSGIRAARLYIDGSMVDEQLSSCSYDRPRPCTDLPVSQPLSLDPATISDGQHQLQLAVVDAAGNETRTAAVTRTVDGTPPQAPALTQTQPKINESTVSWQPAVAGAIATTGSQWRVCRYEGQECGTWTTLTAAAGSVDQSVYAPRLSVEVRNIDALGRTGPQASIALPWTFIPGGPAGTTPTTTTGTSTTPTTPTTPRSKSTVALKIRSASSRARMVTVAGSSSFRAAKLSVTLTAKGKKRIVRTVRASKGRWRLVLKAVPAGRWKLTVRYPGSSTRLSATTSRTITVR